MRKKVPGFDDFFFIKQGSLGKKAQQENDRILEDKLESAVNQATLKIVTGALKGFNM